MAEDSAWSSRRRRPKSEAPVWRNLEDDTSYVDDSLNVRGRLSVDGVEITPGGAHPDLATHDALGLSTDAELAAHSAAGDPHSVYATNAELDLHTGDTVDAHDASAVSILDLAGTFTATEVEAALAELTSDDVAHAALPNIHHAEFTNPQHDALPNPHHSNANDHPQAHADTSHTDPPILKALVTLLGDIIYATASATVARLAGNITTTRKFLRQTGNGAVSAAPVWDTLVDGDVPASHSGSTHAATQAAAEATAAGALSTHAGAVDPHTGYLKESDYNAKGDLISASANDTPSTVTVGANDTILMADSAAAAGLKWVAPATPSTQAFGDAAAEGTGDTFTRGDHKHGIPADPVTAHVGAADPHSGYVLESLLDVKGDIIAASADNTPAKVAAGSNGQYLTAQSGQAAGLLWVTHDSTGDPHTQYPTQAEFDDHSARHESAGADAVKLDDLAATDDNTDLNATTSAHGLMQKYPGGTTNFLRADGTFAAPTASVALTTVEKSLGAAPSAPRSGSFQITGLSGLTTDKAVLIQQASGPYTGKGTRQDEAEMDMVVVTGKVLNSTTIQCYWKSHHQTRGNFKFDYLISA